MNSGEISPVPLYNQQGMNFFHNGPIRRSIASKKTVYELHGTVVRAGPAAFKHDSVMEDYDAPGLDKRAPVIPILFDSFVAMVPVDEKEVEGLHPALRGLVAEFFDPNDATLIATLDRAVCRPLREIEERDAAEVKWIDQIKRSIFGHGFAQSHRRDTLRNANLNHRRAAGSPTLHRSMLGRGMLSERGTKPKPCKSGMPQQCR